MRLTHVILALMVLAALATHVNANRALKDYDYEDYEEECDTWDASWDANYRWVGGSSVGTYSAASVAACGDMCIEEDGCFSFNFYKRKCYMFEDYAAELDSRYAKGYSAGEIYCNDKKKK
jgi:PAN domain